jgi:hypothetical protein
VEDDTMDQRALPTPERPERPRGRHEAQRQFVGGPARAAIAVVVGSVVVALVLATWLISSAKEAPPPSAGVGSTAQDAPTSRPPGRRRSATWSSTGASSRT